MGDREFSTGAHTHLGLYRTDASGNKLDKNGATGSYNPALCFSGEFAIDQASEELLESGRQAAGGVLSRGAIGRATILGEASRASITHK